jgi:anti-sigma regulatory factor (Ser/Thr protein kinase)
MTSCLQEVIDDPRTQTRDYEIGNVPHLILPLIASLLEDLGLRELLDTSESSKVGVALQEALTNALYHGNLEVSSDLRQVDEAEFYALAERRRGQEPYRDRRIRLHARLDGRECTFVITDQGPGFDTSRLDRPIVSEDTERVGGRGLLMIRAYMDEVWLNQAGNQITMIKRPRHGWRDSAVPRNGLHFDRS